MGLVDGHKGFKIEEVSIISTHWLVKLIWSKKAPDKHLAVFYDKESLEIFTEALESKGIKNLTDVNPFD